MTAPRLGTSRFAGDDGSPDAALAAALAPLAERADDQPNDDQPNDDRPDDDLPAAVSRALVTARLLVPVVARPREAGDHGHGAEMATPLLVGTDGRKGLPAFTGLPALGAWQADARPVPLLGPQAASAALDAGSDLLVLDVAGPVRHLLMGARLRALAEGRAWVPVLADPDVRAALAELLDPLGEVAAWRLVPAADADARLQLQLAPGVDPAVAHAIAGRLAEHPLLRLRLDRGLELAVLPPSG